MAYVTSFERLGIEKGLQQGRQQGLQEGRQQGRQEGERHKALVIAKNLLKQNISWSVIQSATGLSEQVLSLRKAEL
jgi:predicted transposase/invertase (TIGR01784 family)